MLIPIETWTILSVDDEKGIISHVVGAYCPLAVRAPKPEGLGSGVETQCITSLPCSNGLSRCEYFHYADSEGIECIYNEVETDVIDGQTLHKE